MTKSLLKRRHPASAHPALIYPLAQLFTLIGFQRPLLRLLLNLFKR